MTLMELLVVLVILAVVATIAVQSLQPRVESARFEQTQAILDQLEDATCGDPLARQADGSPLIRGFVADVGRLPIARRPVPVGPVDLRSAPNAKQLDPNRFSLSELWDPQSELAVQFPFQFRPGPQSPVDCSDIRLPCGWRSPYLALPMGRNELTDAWAQPFELTMNAARQVEQVTWNPVGDFEQPLVCDFSQALVTVTGTIEFGENSSVSVQTVIVVPDPEHSTTELKIIEDSDSSPGTFQFENVPVGLRAIRVVADGKVFTKYVEVPHGGLTLLFHADQAREPQP